MVLILLNVCTDNRTFYIGVSVPLRGLWFLSDDGESEKPKYYAGFRPLAGIMVLICCLANYIEHM